MAETLIILVLLFDGTLIQEKYNLSRPIEVHECLSMADEHRNEISHYREFDDPIRNGWYLNDGRGTVQGFICE
jgi:hypothetical protein